MPVIPDLEEWREERTRPGVRQPAFDHAPDTSEYARQLGAGLFESSVPLYPITQLEETIQSAAADMAIGRYLAGLGNEPVRFTFHPGVGVSSLCTRDGRPCEGRPSIPATRISSMYRRHGIRAEKTTGSSEDRMVQVGELLSNSKLPRVGKRLKTTSAPSSRLTKVV